MRTFTLILIGFVAISTAAQTLFGQVSATTSSPQDVTLAFTVPGRIARIAVRPGDRVKAGQVLVELEAFERRIQMELARLHAETDMGMRQARQRYQLAKIEEDRFGKKATGMIEYRRARAARGEAELELDEARLKQTQARLQYEMALARYEQCSLRAPADGIVERVHVTKGQAVPTGTDVIRLLQNDQLWVDAAVPTEQTYDLRVGSTAWVVPKRTIGDEPIEGRIEHLSAMIDIETDTRRVRISVPNRTGLLVGAHVAVRFRAPPAE